MCKNDNFQGLEALETEVFATFVPLIDYHISVLPNGKRQVKTPFTENPVDLEIFEKKFGSIEVKLRELEKEFGEHVQRARDLLSATPEKYWITVRKGSDETKRPIVTYREIDVLTVQKRLQNSGYDIVSCVREGENSGI